MGANGIQLVDLMALGWAEEFYDEETNEEWHQNQIPDPCTWDEGVIAEIERMGYEIAQVKSSYAEE